MSLSTTSSTRTRGRRARRVAAAAAAAVLSLSAVSAVSSGAASASSGPPGPDRAGLQAGLDRLVDAGAVGAVAEVRDGHGTWRGTSGRAEIGSSRRVPVESSVRIGSITKTYVATVMLQLVDEGRLGLDDPLGRWLPGAVPGGDGVTVRQLLTHTSGIYDYQDALVMPPSPEFLDEVGRTWRPSQLVRRAVASGPAPTPVTSGIAYSNTNYILLGEVIETVTGRSYSEEIERRILRPLGLRDTTLPGTSTRLRGPHPHGYVPIAEDGVERLVDLTQMNPSIFGAAGEIVSTPADVDQFFAALLDGRLLPAHLLHLMMTPANAGADYGMGLFLRTTSCGVPVYGNDGDAVAYQTWSYSTADGRRQVTLALTPDFRARLDDQVMAYVDAAVCS